MKIKAYELLKEGQNDKPPGFGWCQLQLTSWKALIHVFSRVHNGDGAQIHHKKFGRCTYLGEGQEGRGKGPEVLAGLMR